MGKPCGPPLCSLFCTLELDYSWCFDPQIFIKVSALQLCVSHCSRHCWVGELWYEMWLLPLESGQCAWRDTLSSNGKQQSAAPVGA